MAQADILPKPGIFRPATPQAAAGRWWDCNLMRFRGGQLQPIGGNAHLLGADFDGPGRDVLTWHDNTGKRWAAVGTDAKLWAYDFDLKAVHDITPAGVGGLAPPGALDGYGMANYGAENYGTARDPADIGPADVSAVLGDWWSLDIFGEDLMIVPTQDGRLFRWKPATPATLPAVVPNAPVQNRGVIVTEERHVVLLGAGGNGRLVQWCDQENPEVWADAVDNLAGNKQLLTQGRVMRAIRVPGGILIHTDNDAHLMRYVGAPYAYGINAIGFNCGLLSPRAVAVAGGKAQWMGAHGFWVYGGTVEAVDCDVQDWLFSLLNASQIGRVFAWPHPSFSEIWYHWPSEGAVECNRYVAVNYGERGTPWIIGLSSRTGGDASGSMNRPILAGGTKLYLHEYGWTDDGVSRLGLIYAETAEIASQQLGGDPERWVHVRSLRHNYVGPAGAVGFRFFTWAEPDGPQFDNGSIPAGDYSGITDVDFACYGMRMRIESLADGPFALGVTKMIFSQRGKQ